MAKKIAVLAFTKTGKDLRCIIEDTLSQKGYDVYKIPEGESQKQYVADNFNELDCFIFIGASGIAVRFIAPYVKSKDVDPAVILIDELGRYCISLLSGHLGGANELSEDISNAIGAIPIITTATDINNKFAVDVWSKSIDGKIVDISKIKMISSAILEDRPVGFHSDFPIKGNIPEYFSSKDDSLGVCLSFDEHLKPFKDTLNIVPRILTLGVGCRRDTDTAAFENFVLDNLQDLGISLKAVKNIGSIDLKKDEKCIISFSEKYKIPFETATADELNKVEGKFNGSEFVKKITGVDSVCERSAVKFSNNGKIIVSKRSHEGMTMALTINEWSVDF